MRTVTINDIDMFSEFGMILTHREISPLVPKIYKVNVPGRSGDIDFTSFYGDIKYENRTVTMTFVRDCAQSVRAQIESMCGQLCSVIFSDEPNIVWSGRLSINSMNDDTLLENIILVLDAYPHPTEVD